MRDEVDPPVPSRPNWLLVLVPVGAWLAFVLASSTGCERSPDPERVGFLGDCAAASTVNLIFGVLAVVALGISATIFATSSRRSGQPRTYRRGSSSSSDTSQVSRDAPIGDQRDSRWRLRAPGDRLLAAGMVFLVLGLSYWARGHDDLWSHVGDLGARVAPPAVHLSVAAVLVGLGLARKTRPTR